MTIHEFMQVSRNRGWLPNGMIKIENDELEAERYLAFYTLAFALMGRNVKSIYFNDLMGLPNDYEKFNESGELRVES